MPYGKSLESRKIEKILGGVSPTAKVAIPWSDLWLMEAESTTWVTSRGGDSSPDIITALNGSFTDEIGPQAYRRETHARFIVPDAPALQEYMVTVNWGTWTQVPDSSMWECFWYPRGGSPAIINSNILPSWTNYFSVDGNLSKSAELPFLIEATNGIIDLYFLSSTYRLDANPGLSTTVGWGVTTQSDLTIDVDDGSAFGNVLFGSFPI